MLIHNHYSLKAHNTFGLTARCKRFIEFSTEAEAVEVAAALQSAGDPFLIIGQGSNLLLTRDYPGIVVRSAILGRSMQHETDTALLLTCGSGERWDDIVSWTVGEGFASLVNLSLIPGDVGASAVQNIGAYGAEVAQFVHHVHAVDLNTLQIVDIPAADCGYAYRQSRFKQEWRNRFLILSVTYRLRTDEPLQLDYGNIRDELSRRQIADPTAAQLRQVIIDIRRLKLPDPSELGNAGSFFMNPIVSRELFGQLRERYPEMPHYDVDAQRVKVPAAWLIDQCGWKGRQMGRAGVHGRQPLVLVNLGGATGDEIVKLCRAIQDDVRHRFGIALQPEVNIV